MTRLEALEARLEPTLAALGFEVVRVALSSGSRRTLQVMADRRDGRTISVDDCAAISDVLSALFDVEEPVAGAYDLEVSSPGNHRPLTRPKDFAGYAGHEAKVETKLPQDGRRRFKGTLLGLSPAGGVRMDIDGTEIEIEASNIMAAKLVMTDKLIDASRTSANA